MLNKANDVFGIAQNVLDAKIAAKQKKWSEAEQKLIGIVSHDLRNPLSSIGMAAAILEKRTTDEKDRKVLERIGNATKRAARLITDFLDFAQSRANGAIPIHPTACDLADKPGCARLAVLEAQGLGVPLNAAHARQTLESLCAEKVPEACIGLAQILQRTGFATDRDRARTLLKAACDGGSAEACGLMTAR